MRDLDDRPISGHVSHRNPLSAFRSAEALSHPVGEDRILTATQTLTPDQVRKLAIRVLSDAGVDERGAAILGDLVTKSECDGPKSHGLAMLPRYVQSFSSGYANPVARPRITRTAPSVLRGDGDNGYYQIALDAARPQIIDTARQAGIAGFTCANCHHLAALKFDTEALAAEGLIALSVVNSLALIVPEGGTRPLFGTNPMSFACPRPDGPPIVWDQASSVAALMDIRMAAAVGEALPHPAGLDASGQPTVDASVIAETMHLLPFAGHKGTAIALMIEVLGAALAGGRLSTETDEKDRFGALNLKPGVTLIVLDPARWGSDGFADAITRIAESFARTDGARIPGDGRLARRRRAETNGIDADSALLASLGWSG